MKKILLVDDLAKKGWKDVLQKAVVKSSGNLFSVPSIDSALDEINQNKYDLIFLDVRMTEEDHNQKDYRRMTGYLILKEIKKEFTSVNFSTPLILLTASNKIWIIEEFKELGIDAFYIKEHPDNGFSNSYSRENLERLQQNYLTLIKLGEKRDKILSSINFINKLVEKKIQNGNIRKRIIEKLKIGYALLFRKLNTVEKNILLFNNEINSFIVFWSILEEVSHDYFGRLSKLEKQWIIKSNNEKIQWIEKGVLKSKFSTVKKEFISVVETTETDNSYQVNLSNQIAALLRYRLHWDYNKIRQEFLDKLNKYRNEIDFIHSSTKNIIHKEISKTYDQEEAFTKCNNVLNFIGKMLDS